MMEYSYNDFLNDIAGTHINGAADLYHMWSEPHRRYHDLSHLRHGLKIADEMVRRFTFDHAHKHVVDHVKAAWALHDASYVVGSKVNEEISAALVDHFVSANYMNNDLIRKMVRITKNHDCPHSIEEAIIIDLDLWGLGADEDIYRHNSFLVEQEYLQQFTESEFRGGRVDWLKKMLGKDAIFYTPVGFKREAQARLNMQLELHRIQDAMAKGL